MLLLRWTLLAALLLAARFVALAQTPVEKYRAAKDRLKQLETQLNGCSKTPTPACKDVARQLREQYTATAQALMNLVTADPGPREIQARSYYQIGNYYQKAGLCWSSQAYLQHCLDLQPECKTAMLENIPLERHATKAMKSCRKAPTSQVKGSVKYLNTTEGGSFGYRDGGLRSIGNGKRLYIFLRDLPKLDTNDLLPLSQDEVMMLEARVFKRNEVQAALPVYEQFGTVVSQKSDLDRTPVALVLLSGEMPAAYPLNEKTTSQELENDRAAAPASSPVQMEGLQGLVHAAYRTLHSRYFTQADSMPVVPVYLSGIHKNDSKGYRDYVTAAKNIHFRRNTYTVSYYNELDNSILCWMGSGGGSLTHELAHAMMHYEYPEAPAWLAEGLAAMYESTDRDWKPIGNYRLRYIRQAKDSMRSHLGLCNLLTLPWEACNSSPLAPVYSAYSRYFSLFLNEKGLLEPFYKTARDSSFTTSSQQVTLLEVLLRKNQGEIEKEWWAWLDAQALPQKWARSDLAIVRYTKEDQAAWKAVDCGKKP